MEWWKRQNLFMVISSGLSKEMTFKPNPKNQAAASPAKSKREEYTFRSWTGGTCSVGWRNRNKASVTTAQRENWTNCKQIQNRLWWGLSKMLDFILNAKESHWMILKGLEGRHKQTDVFYFVEKVAVKGQE